MQDFVHPQYATVCVRGETHGKSANIIWKKTSGFNGNMIGKYDSVSHINGNMNDSIGYIGKWYQGYHMMMGFSWFLQFWMMGWWFSRKKIGFHGQLWDHSGQMWGLILDNKGIGQLLWRKRWKVGSSGDSPFKFTSSCPKVFLVTNIYQVLDQVYHIFPYLL